ncbi:MAG: glycoside hydrolase family 71/99 protein [Saccharofermentanales bacterium]
MKRFRILLPIIAITLAMILPSCTKPSTTGGLSVIGSSQPASSNADGQKEYYTSKIGMWYTVWWQNKEESTPVQFRTYASHWEEWSRLEPVRGYYSSGDPAIIKEHLSLFHQYGIDYLIIDDTNGHLNDNGSIAYNITQLFKTAKEMGADKVPQLAIALGGSLSNSEGTDQIRSRNLEAGMILKNYIDIYPELYFEWKGKPLLVSYGLTKFFNWTSDLFAVRYATGSFYEAFFSEEGVPDTGFWGWVFSGQSDNDEVYGVIPGFNKGKIPASTPGAYWSQIKREQGEHYMDMWLEAIKADRETIVITSWNDYAEEPAIEAARPRPDAMIDEAAKRLGSPYDIRHERDKLNGADRHNVWLDYYGELAPYWYEEITWAYASLKTTLLESYYYREEGSDTMYQYLDGELNEQTEKPHGHPVIRIPDGYFDWFFDNK